MNARAAGPGSAVARGGTGPSEVWTGTIGAAGGAGGEPGAKGVGACSMVIAPPVRSMRPQTSGSHQLSHGSRPATGVGLLRWLSEVEPVRLPLGWNRLL